MYHYNVQVAEVICSSFHLKDQNQLVCARVLFVWKKKSVGKKTVKLL